MPRRRFSLSKRLFIAARAGFLCEYCHTPEDFSPDLFNIEHIIPLLHEGTDEDDNLAHACDLLKMNRPGLINLRKALLAYGMHPGKPVAK